VLWSREKATPRGSDLPELPCRVEWVLRCSHPRLTASAQPLKPRSYTHAKGVIANGDERRIAPISQIIATCVHDLRQKIRGEVHGLCRTARFFSRVARRSANCTELFTLGQGRSAYRSAKENVDKRRLSVAMATVSAVTKAATVSAWAGSHERPY
jgi:hypothetical protein